MIRFAIKGLATRKLRTALTAIAIVLGVSLVTGTYILTDSIKGAFNGIFSEVYRGTDATITGQAAFDLSSENNTQPPPFDDSLLAEVRKLPDVDQAVGGVGGTAYLIGKNGKAIIFGGAPNLGFSVDPDNPDLSSLKLDRGELAEGAGARRRQVDRREEGSEGRRHDRRPGAGPGAEDAHLGDRQVRRGEQPRRRDARGLRPADRADALRARRASSTRSARRRSPACRPSGWPARSRGSSRRGHRSAPAQAQAKEDAKDVEGFTQLPPDVPARVRRSSRSSSARS